MDTPLINKEIKVENESNVENCNVPFGCLLRVSGLTRAYTIQNEKPNSE